MKMVGRRGATSRSVVENGVSVKLFREPKHVGKSSCDALRPVADGGYGEMCGEDGKRIDENFISAVGDGTLHRRTVDAA